MGLVEAVGGERLDERLDPAPGADELLQVLDHLGVGLGERRVVQRLVVRRRIREADLLGEDRLARARDAENMIYDINEVIPVHFFDGLASTTHVGLIYIEYSDGTDAIFEAKGEASGTGIWTRTYRGQSAYTSTGRTGWTG